MDLTQTRFRINEPQVTAKVMDGEAIIIDLSSGIYYSLSGTGGAIWSGLEAGLSPHGVLDALTTACKVDREEAGRDLSDLITEMQNAGLIVVADDAAPAADAENAEITGFSGAEYEKPLLNRYEDMAELFALDPPLPDTLKA